MGNKSRENSSGEGSTKSSKKHSRKNVKKASQKSKTLTTFHRFPDLPLEVRLAIWRLAVSPHDNLVYRIEAMPELHEWRIPQTSKADLPLLFPNRECYLEVTGGPRVKTLLEKITMLFEFCDFFCKLYERLHRDPPFMIVSLSIINLIPLQTCVSTFANLSELWIEDDSCGDDQSRCSMVVKIGELDIGPEGEMDSPLRIPRAPEELKPLLRELRKNNRSNLPVVYLW